MPHPAKQTDRHDRSARPLLSTCAVGLALAALAHGGRAEAQVHAIQGTGNVVAGLAVIDDVGGTAANPRTNIRLDSSTVVINWTPSDASAGATPIDFVSANGLAYFYSQTDPNFTVLNRVLPATTRAVGINGSVQGIYDFSGVTTTAGNVWFYSPTGIVAGSGSSFSANGVILTANDIPFTSAGISYGPNGEIPFESAPGSQAQVAMLPGSLIANSGDGGYALLVAPSVVQAGTIQLDGSVGIVAAEKASIIVSNSLFDIDVEVGTSVVNAIVHSGTTGAYVSGGVVPGAQNVVLMAVPQSTAITMLLGGSLGADATAVASDRSVIISGGYDYNDLSAGGLASTPDSTIPVNVTIGTSTFNAQTTALATGSISVNASRGTAVAFLDNASLTAGSTASVTAELDETITVTGNLLVNGPTAQVLLTGTNAETGSGTAAARIDVSGDLTVDASMVGTTPGGDGIGGTASIQLDAGTAAPLLSVGGSTLVVADGTGQEGPASGGGGFGGLAQIVVNGGTLSLGDVTIRANGRGLDAFMSGTGGDAAGGTAQFVAAGSYSIRDLVISANGEAGYALLAADSGAGRGGTARFVNHGSAAAAPDSRVVDSLLVEASGFGDISGGRDNAVGGLAQLSDLASGANARARFGNVDLRAEGYATLAGKGALIESAGGTLTIDDALNVDSAGTVTISVSGNSTIAANGSVGIYSTLEDVVINHTGQGAPLASTIASDFVLIDAERNIVAGADTLLSGGSALLLRARDGNITAGNLTAVDQIQVEALGNVFVKDVVTTGPFTDFSSFLSGGQIHIIAGAPSIEFFGPYLPADVVIGGNVSASGELMVRAGRDILGVSTPSSLQGERVSLIAERDIGAPNLAILSRRSLDTFVSRDLIAGGVDVVGELNMLDPAGYPALTGQLVIPGTLSIGNLTLRGSTPGLMRAAGDLTIGQARATGLDLSAGGTLTIGSLSGYSSSLADYLVASAPSIALDGIRVAGDITAVASEAAKIGNASAGAALTVETPGTVTFSGMASGATVRASSGDIVIAPGARVGTPGTTRLVELSNNSTATSYVGGPDNALGYSLNQAEASQLFADDITINGSDFVVGAMNLTGSQLGAEGTFSIHTMGNVRIGGAVNFSGMGNGQTFAIHAGDLIVLDNQAGSVNLTGSGSAPGGILDFSAARIMAVSNATRAALSSLTDPVAIDALLGTNDGAVNDAGVLRAGTLQFTVSQGLYIQNTGDNGNYLERRGFSAGPGGIAVNFSSGPNAPLVVINGAVQGTDGNPLTSLAAIPLVRINGQPAPTSSGSAAGSTINGCDFTNVTECAKVLTTIAATTPTRDLIEDPVDTPSNATVERQALISTTVAMEDFGLQPYEPLIDEPVTGTGNDDLWGPNCDASGQGSCAPSPGAEADPR